MDIKKEFDLNQLVPDTNKTLKDIEDLKLLDAKISTSILFNGSSQFQAKLFPSLGANVFLINDKEDDDENELLQKLNYDSIIDRKAVLEYDLIGHLNVKAGFEVGYFDLGFSANQELALSYFQPHSNTEILLNAIGGDLSNQKSILSIKDIEQLDEGAAVAISLHGKLAADVELSFSDLLTCSLKKLSGLLKLTDVLQVEIESGLSVGFDVQFKDKFEILIQKRSDKYWVSIHKAIKNTWGTNFGAELGVSLKNPEIINSVFFKMLDNIEEGLGDEIDKLLKKDIKNFSFEDLETLKDTAKSLGLSVPDILPSDYAKKLQNQVSKKLKKLKDSIENILTTSVKIGFDYEYSKSKSRDSLFSGDFTLQSIKNNYKNILRLDTKEMILKSKSKNNGITNASYRKLTELDIKRVTKIGVRLGDWVLGQKVEKLRGLDIEELYQDGVIKKRIQNIEIGKKTVENLGRTTITNSMLLSASMPNYVNNDSIIACNQLDYELALSWNWSQGNKTKSDELKDVLDFALCWGIIKPGDFENKYEELKGEIVGSKVKKIGFEGHIKAPISIFDSLIDDIAVISNNDLAQVMAESVPYADVRGRMTLRERKAFYTDFWLMFLNENPSVVSSQAVQEHFINNFTNKGLPDLADYEANQDGYSYFDRYTILNLIETNYLNKQFFLFKDAITKLHKGMGQNYSKILNDKAFKRKLRSIRLQRVFNMRVIGRLILTLAERNQVLDQISRSMEIKIPNKKSIHITN